LALAAENVSTDSCQQTWPTYAVIGLLTDPLVCFVVIGHPSHATMLCCAAKNRSRWSAILDGSYWFCSLSPLWDWPVWHPEEYRHIKQEAQQNITKYH